LSSEKVRFGRGGKIVQYEAKARGTHSPKLKVNGQVETTIRPQDFRQENDPSGYYEMTSAYHGVAFIINNRTFKDTIRHGEREGTERDEYNLLQTCAFLGYRPVIFRDLTSNEIMQVFEETDKFLKDSDNNARFKVAHDSLICCILSHGDRGVVFGSDSKSVRIGDIERGIGKSKILNNKPKIFFIQASLGDMKDDGTEAISTITSDDLSTSGSAHIYFCMACAVGYQAYRNRMRGSWFIIEVCKILCEFGKCFKFPDDFQPLLNKNMANNRYQEKYVQQPVGLNQLQGCIHFFSQDVGKELQGGLCRSYLCMVDVM
jgi:hypothetical protein